MRRARSTAPPMETRVSMGEVRKIEHAARLVTVSGTLGDSIPDLKDAIVKAIPLADWSPEDRLQFKQTIENSGARHVWLAPAQGKQRIVPERATTKQVKGETLRQAADALIAEARTNDRERLRAIVEAALTAEGA